MLDEEAMNKFSGAILQRPVHYIIVIEIPKSEPIFFNFCEEEAAKLAEQNQEITKTLHRELAPWPPCGEGGEQEEPLKAAEPSGSTGACDDSRRGPARTPEEKLGNDDDTPQEKDHEERFTEEKYYEKNQEEHNKAESQWQARPGSVKQKLAAYAWQRMMNPSWRTQQTLVGATKWEKKAKQRWQQKCTVIAGAKTQQEHETTKWAEQERCDVAEAKKKADDKRRTKANDKCEENFKAMDTALGELEAAKAAKKQAEDRLREAIRKNKTVRRVQKEGTTGKSIRQLPTVMMIETRGSKLSSGANTRVEA